MGNTSGFWMWVGLWALFLILLAVLFFAKGTGREEDEEKRAFSRDSTSFLGRTRADLPDVGRVVEVLRANMAEDHHHRLEGVGDFSQLCSNLSGYFTPGMGPGPHGQQRSENMFELRGLPTDLPLGREMRILGRRETLRDALPDYYGRIRQLGVPVPQWSSTMNDAFVLCTYLETAGSRDGFRIMLVVRHGVAYRGFLDGASMRPDARVEPEERKQYQCDEHCIFPPSPHPHNFRRPTITYTEVVLLTDYFGMECYWLEGARLREKYEVYLFADRETLRGGQVQLFNDRHDLAGDGVRLRRVQARQ